MLGEPELVGLLYRADWTRLSLSARLVGVTEDGPESVVVPGWPPGRRVRHASRGSASDPPNGPRRPTRRITARLLVAPGRRYRLDTSHEDGHAFLRGCDGDRPWQQFSGPDDGSEVYIFGDPEPPVPELMQPAWLLSGFELGPAEPTVVGARDAYRIVATPRRPSRGPAEAARLANQVEAIVDAELGILLRCEKTYDGREPDLSELIDVLLDPPEAGDPAQFAPPSGSTIGESYAAFFDGPGWRAGKTAGGMAAAGLAHMIRLTRHHRPPAESSGETMPRDEAADGLGHQDADSPPVSDDVLYRLYRAGLAGPDFTAEYHEWLDGTVLTEMMRSAGSTSGPGGLLSLAEAIGETATVVHRVTRIRIAAQDRYRIDYLSGFPERTPEAVACDGQRRWREFADHVTVGPAAPPPLDVFALIDPSRLLARLLSDGGEVTVGGRTGYRLRATHEGIPAVRAASFMFALSVAVLDADLGILLSLARYAGGRPFIRQELRDVTLADAEDPPDFDADVPPGVRIVEDTGGPFNEFDPPEPLRLAFRAVNGTARRASEGAATIASFLDSLRGKGPG